VRAGSLFTLLLLLLTLDTTVGSPIPAERSENSVVPEGGSVTLQHLNTLEASHAEGMRRLEESYKRFVDSLPAMPIIADPFETTMGGAGPVDKPQAESMVTDQDGDSSRTIRLWKDTERKPAGKGRKRGRNRGLSQQKARQKSP